MTDCEPCNKVRAALIRVREWLMGHGKVLHPQHEQAIAQKLAQMPDMNELDRIMREEKL